MFKKKCSEANKRGRPYSSMDLFRMFFAGSGGSRSPNSTTHSQRFSPKLDCSACCRPLNTVKVICSSCNNNYCTACSQWKPGGYTQCLRCAILTSRNITREQISQLSVRDLKWYLARHNLSSSGFIEKDEFVVRVMDHLEFTGRTAAHPSEPSHHRSRSSHSDPTVCDVHTTADDVFRERVTLDSVQSESDIEQLTARQLKQLLTDNCVDFTGCLERDELIIRVRHLWLNRCPNSTPHLQLRTPEMTSPNRVGEPLSGDIAKQDRDPKLHQNVVSEDPLDNKDECCICMEAPANCVLLECGHMIVCVSCGKKLTSCPICRQTVTRVVRTFRL